MFSTDYPDFMNEPGPLGQHLFDTRKECCDVYPCVDEEYWYLNLQTNVCEFGVGYNPAYLEQPEGHLFSTKEECLEVWGTTVAAPETTTTTSTTTQKATTTQAATTTTATTQPATTLDDSTLPTLPSEPIPCVPSFTDDGTDNDACPSGGGYYCGLQVGQCNAPPEYHNGFCQLTPMVCPEVSVVIYEYRLGGYIYLLGRSFLYVSIVWLTHFFMLFNFSELRACVWMRR